MLQTVENDTKVYLKKIMTTIFVGLFWMFAHVIAGIFLGYALIGNKLNLGNYIYYSLLLVSFAWLIYYYIKLWKSDFVKKPIGFYR